MLDKKFAEHFATEWIASWNSHNLTRILSHYTEDFEMSSPVIAQIAGEPSGRLKGKEAIGAYWKKALEKTPDLRFEHINTLTGPDSVTILYRGHRGQTAEVLFFNGEKKVFRAAAHYA